MHWFLRMLITSQGEILGRKTARRLKYFLSCKPAKTQLWFATQTKILTFHFHTKASQVTNVMMVAPLGNCTTYNFFCRHCPQASYDVRIYESSLQRRADAEKGRLPACLHAAHLVPQRAFCKQQLGCLMEPSCVCLKWSCPGWGVKRKPHSTTICSTN